MNCCGGVEGHAVKPCLTVCVDILRHAGAIKSKADVPERRERCVALERSFQQIIRAIWKQGREHNQRHNG